MKKCMMMAILFIAIHSYGQENEREAKAEGGFKKDHLFTGGGLQLSFSNNTFIAGASPVLGYSINKWLDAGISFNFTYYSNRHVVYYNPNTGFYFTSDDKLHQTLFGPGAFVRAYPVKFIFVQAQSELNFISEKLIYASGAPNDKEHYEVPSLLLGAGYCSGRQGIGDLFYYVSISVDVLKNKHSPYVEQISNGNVNILPIIRAGLQIPLFQGKGLFN